MSEIDTSPEYIAKVIAAAPFADNEAGIPQMVELIQALAARLAEAEAERDELDFILHEGGDDSVAKLIEAKEAAESELTRLRPAHGAEEDIDAIENSGRRWHGWEHRVVRVRWEPYKPDGQRQMKAKGRWQEQQGSGDYWRWTNCNRPSSIRAPAQENKI